MPIITTLADIRKACPCEDGWAKLLSGLDCSRIEAKNNYSPLPVEVVLDYCGVDDTLWIIDRVICDDYLTRYISADMAEMSLFIFEKEYPDDDRPRKAIEVARDKTLTIEDWEAARSAAKSAAEAAANTIEAAAGSTAWEAAWATTRSTTLEAARSAIEAVAWEAARSATAMAACSTLRAKQATRLRLYLKYGIAAKDIEER